ncbi:hypothetical protein F5Y13DRAFT_156312 [Hypoxylon sp. FL1857]|nr:hypothetical protein F5Y13DRAFT_156312 [Hypoxylon sp. FL1857]
MTTMSYEAENTASFKVHTMIHSKYVPSSKGLSIILLEELGEGKFEVEMRHNIYDIKSSAELNPRTLQKIRELSKSLKVSI